MMFKTNKNRSILTVVYLVLFLSLEVLVTTKNAFIANFDTQIQNSITPMVNAMRTSIMVVVSFIGSPVVSLLLAMFIAILFYSKKRKVDGIWTALTFLGGDALAFIVKEVVHRARPTDKVVPDSGYSFPSGHIFGLTLLVLIIIYLVLPYVQNQESRFVFGLLAVIWLLVVSFARLYLRGHFASDILGSMLLAGTWWKCCEMLYIRYYQKVTSYLKIKLN
ncbi:phosphatase PAP2 family protein [Companilactobacillus nantensis]|uniref:Phosphatidylglycerophosphatase B n=1 Tax=Companilactobacillus nantensis DSM 16982 TaxID=1423774 RepID=A0A0R1WJA2_9LACO|nr:phosphatase PAP2 family protein [Companilactobacillus nantensis]KRM17677.1 phosphatidylglycerophosphatase B [Companilactobacillus nantensis DSM 16982]GEO63390.1 phosphatidylglycerophosphatase B [Companilactobacillus nantensis]